MVSSSVDAATRAAAVQRMVQSLVHRGPDDHGIVNADPASLGMRRLAIIDPANGRQPMQSPDGRFTLVFNGAIYNFRELRETLRDAWNFQTDCDTEVLLATFARHGSACLGKLRGMFTFAVWDARERTLFAARDAFGIKPLYYAAARDGFAFASEIRALFPSGMVQPEIDPAAVSEFLAWFSVPAPRTIYSGVVNLPPGHCLEVTPSGRVTSRAWWRLPQGRGSARVATSYAEFAHGLRYQLEDTIRAHCIADVPVGAFLSGGLDSSAVVGLMSRIGRQRLKTFSLVFQEPGYSEQAAARLASSAFGTEHHEHLLTGKEIAADLPKILATFDQPSGDGINVYYASRLARAGGVKVALSGLGGDELFGGYPSFRDLPRLAALLPAWRAIPSRMRELTIDALRSRNSARAQKLADFLAHARDLHELAALQRRVLPEASRLSLLSRDARTNALRSGPMHPLLDENVRDLLSADSYQAISAWELRTYMADVLLRDSDVFSMAHSLELRVPFIDTSLVSWLWPQPAWFKRDPSIAKRALADVTADLVPAAIRNRGKKGFALPMDRWMRSDLRPFLDETFSPGSLAACPWLDAPNARMYWEDFLRGHDSRSWSRVWTLAVLIAFANRRPAAVSLAA